MSLTYADYGVEITVIFCSNSFIIHFAAHKVYDTSQSGTIDEASVHKTLFCYMPWEW
jgi:hypothetical protein